jgi:hypothetical protein
MRARPDAGLRADIRARLGRIGKWDSIETGGTEGGVPDMHVMVRGGPEVWIECKSTSGSAVVFRPGQVGWLFTHWRYGGTAYIFTRRVTNRVRMENVDELHVHSAQFARELSVHGLLAVPAMATWSGGIGQWNWSSIEALIRGAQPSEADPAEPVDRRWSKRGRR